MSNMELQEEELEVLRSIYDGDTSFKEISTTAFQYKYGEDNSYRSFVVEISWSGDYPEQTPTINVNTFYNKHVIDSVKNKITTGIKEQIEDLLGCAMTYSLFEWVKENYEDLIADQPETMPVNRVEDRLEPSSEAQNEDPARKKEKKEQLTKHQKRRLYEKMGNATGEKPRGWNWVDIVKHLSQTGGQQDA